MHGQRPPLEFVLKAYLKTMAVFLDMINTHDKSLSTCVQDSHRWESIWTTWAPAVVHEFSVVNHPPSATPTVIQLDPKFEQRMLQVHKIGKTLLRQSNKGGGKDGGKHFRGNDNWKPKGKGKGKGKHGKNGKNQDRWNNGQQGKGHVNQQGKWSKPNWNGNKGGGKWHQK